MLEFSKVAVLYGGESVERAVSLNSAQAVSSVLAESGYQQCCIEVLPGFITQLLAYQPDICFNVAHGAFGEDGGLSAVLEALGLKYTGSDCQASALAMDKHLSKLLWRHAQLPTLDWQVLTSAQQAEQLSADWALPLAVKPRLGGSSYGISRVDNPVDNPVDNRDQLIQAYANASAYGDVIVEPWAQGNEYTVSIVGERSLPVIAIKASGSFYDYEAKYTRSDTQYKIPSGLSAAQERYLQSISLQAFSLVKARDWGRIDIMQDASGDFYLLELNTVPGMTSTSLVPKAAAAQGWDFGELVQQIMLCAWRRYN